MAKKSLTIRIEEDLEKDIEKLTKRYGFKNISQTIRWVMAKECRREGLIDG